jgi:hypothetical protein
VQKEGSQVELRCAHACVETIETLVEAKSALTVHEKEVRREEVEPISAGSFRTAAGLGKFVKENAGIKFEADLPEYVESPQEDGEPEGGAVTSATSTTSELVGIVKNKVSVRAKHWLL